MPLRQPLGAKLAVRVRGSAVTVRARNVRRPDFAERAPDQAYCGFEARVPLATLRAGLHDLRLVFITPEGQASTMTKPSQGYLRSARTLGLGGVRLVARVDRRDSCQLLVARGRGTLGRLRWQSQAGARGPPARPNKGPLWRMRLLRAATRPFFRNRDVWLLAERHDTAQDNSAALFRHIRQHHPDAAAYYVVDGRPRASREVRPLGHVVHHSSWRHQLLMLHAVSLIGSYDIDGYLLPKDWPKEAYQRHLAWRIGSRRVFLQHGVIYNDVSAALHSGVTGLDLFVTSSAQEAGFVKRRMGYGGEVKVLGLPRFDHLVRNVGTRTRVLFMPTWRVYLVNPSYSTAPNPSKQVPLMGSAYQQFVTDLPQLRPAARGVGQARRTAGVPAPLRGGERGRAAVRAAPPDRRPVTTGNGASRGHCASATSSSPTGPPPSSTSPTSEPPPS